MGPSPDQQRFLEAFLACQHDLRAYLAAGLRAWDQVDDLMQELAAVLWSKFAEYDPERPFRAWALGIARNLLYQHYDRCRRRQRLLSHEALEALEQACRELPEDFDRERHALRDCLATLGERARELVRLRYDLDLGVDQMAERTGSSFEAVKKALVRIRRQLADCCSRRLGTEAPG